MTGPARNEHGARDDTFCRKGETKSLFSAGSEAAEIQGEQNYLDQSLWPPIRCFFLLTFSVFGGKAVRVFFV